MFELMLEKYNNAPMHEEAIRCLSALGLLLVLLIMVVVGLRTMTLDHFLILHFPSSLPAAQSKDKECIEKLLEMTLDDKKIRTSDAVIVYRQLGDSNSNRPLAWNFMKTR